MNCPESPDGWFSIYNRFGLYFRKGTNPTGWVENSPGMYQSLVISGRE
jgi:hypothetical protein